MSLIPARYNFKVYQGATFYKRVLFKVEEKIEDLTEYSVKLVIKDEPEGITLLTLTSETEAIKLGGLTGTIDITITDTETTALQWEEAYYELFVSDESVSPRRTDVLLRGGFKVVQF